MRIEAIDLQSALIKASNELSCSVVDLEYEILQNPKKGFLGIGRKNAIIEARKIKRKNEKKHQDKKQKFDKKSAYKVEQVKQEQSEQEEKKPSKQKYSVKSDEIFDDFHRERHLDRNPEDLLDEIRVQIENLFSKSCFNASLKPTLFL